MSELGDVPANDPVLVQLEAPAAAAPATSSSRELRSIDDEARGLAWEMTGWLSNVREQGLERDDDERRRFCDHYWPRLRDLAEREVQQRTVF